MPTGLHIVRRKQMNMNQNTLSFLPPFISPHPFLDG